jgi:hypothetical protein
LLGYYNYFLQTSPLIRWFENLSKDYFPLHYRIIAEMASKFSLQRMSLQIAA